MRRLILALSPLLWPSPARAEAPPPRPSSPDMPIEPPEAPPPPHEGPAGWEPGFSFKVFSGASFHRLYSTNLYGASFGAAFGGVLRRAALYGSLEGLFGVTQFGLGSRVARLGFSAETYAGDFRLGLGIGAMLIDVSRATSDAIMLTVGFTVNATASYDVFLFDHHAVFLGARFGLDILPGTVMWGPSGFVGCRY
jgi:hypothetical protein